MKLGRILVWRKETSRMTSMPDFTVEIEIEDIRAELLYRFVTAMEKIAEALEKEKRR